MGVALKEEMGPATAGDSGGSSTLKNVDGRLKLRPAPRELGRDNGVTGRTDGSTSGELSREGEGGWDKEYCEDVVELIRLW